MNDNAAEGRAQRQEASDRDREPQRLTFRAEEMYGAGERRDVEVLSVNMKSRGKKDGEKDV